MTTFNMDLVVRVLGVIDREASIAAYTEALDKYIVDSEANETALAEAVHSVFDSAPGKRMAQPLVVQLTMGKLSWTPDTYADTAAAVLKYIQANTGPRFKVDGVTPFARLSMKKGPGQGVCRWNDLPLTEKLD